MVSSYMCIYRRSAMGHSLSWGIVPRRPVNNSYNRKFLTSTMIQIVITTGEMSNTHRDHYYHDSDCSSTSVDIPARSRRHVPPPPRHTHTHTHQRPDVSIVFYPTSTLLLHQITSEHMHDEMTVSRLGNCTLFIIPFSSRDSDENNTE